MRRRRETSRRRHSAHGASATPSVSLTLSNNTSLHPCNPCNGSPLPSSLSRRHRVCVPRSLENQVHREGGRDMFIKQTYSAYRCDDFPDNEPSTSSPDASGSSSAAATPSASTTAEASTSGNMNPADAAAAAQKKRKPRKWHLSACSFSCILFLLRCSRPRFVHSPHRRRHLACCPPKTRLCSIAAGPVFSRRAGTRAGRAR